LSAPGRFVFHSFNGAHSPSWIDLSDAEVDEAVSHVNVRRVRKQDTNIIAVNLGTLADPAIAVATGDPVFCKARKSLFFCLFRSWLLSWP